MKRLFTLALALITLSTALIAKNPEGRRQMVGIAFYNLENLFDTIPNNPENRDLEFTPTGQKQWDSRKYKSKLHNLAYAISQFTTPTTPVGPAIIGVSEIENRSVLDDLVAQPELRPWNLQVVHHDSPDARGVDVGLLYNPIGGERFAFIVNHGPSRLGGQEKSSPTREAAAALSKQIADSLWRVDPEIGVIIMGDLNDDPMDKSCAKVLGAKRDAEGVGVHEFYNPFWRKLDAGIGTLAYKSQWNLFDQIIISGGLANGPEDRWHFYRADVLNKDFLKDTEGSRQGYPRRTFAGGSFLNGFSDHFPTEILLIRYLKSK